MAESLSNEEIEVIVSKEIKLLPESCVSMVFFEFTDQRDRELHLSQSEKKLVDFIQYHKWEYKLGQLEMNSDEYVYKTPAYHISLFSKDFQLIEKYRQDNPKVQYHVVRPSFSKKDKDQLFSELVKQAWRDADEVAIKKGLVLKSDYKAEEIVEKEKQWRIYPPLSVDYDRFSQVLSSRYKFTFKTL